MTLNDLRGYFLGEDCLVVAPGPSAMRVTQAVYESRWTFGCNRAVTFCRPDFAICVEPQRDPVWPIVTASKPFLVFTHIDRASHPRAIHIDRNLDKWLPTDRKKFSLAMSPFYGVGVALALGFETIGLIGVDLDGDGGRFSNDRFQEEWEDKWGELYKIGRNMGSQLINLNKKSLLKALPKIDDFLCVREKR